MRCCSLCGGIGHNMRTCGATRNTSSPTPSERRAAKALAALLPPPNASKKPSKPLEGLAGCKNIWKEPKSFYTPKKVSRPLEDISSCMNIWKEPKSFYIKEKQRENTCSLCGCKGHNSRSCTATPPTVVAKSTTFEKKSKKCGICGGLGHNSRTCGMKCQPCSDQPLRKTEPITFANGFSVNLDLGLE